jgi:hypothetical protein
MVPDTTSDTQRCSRHRPSKNQTSETAVSETNERVEATEERWLTYKTGGRGTRPSSSTIRPRSARRLRDTGTVNSSSTGLVVQTLRRLRPDMFGQR